MKKILISVLIALAIYGAEAQTVVRGPYLQLLTPTSIKIKWRTSATANSRVYYGTSQGNLNLYVDGGNATNHTITLSGLQPNTLYYYSVGTTTQTLSGPSALHYFKTSPVSGTVQPYRFWGIGDFGKANQPQIDVMNSYLNYTGSTHTDMWLWMGDNAYSNGTDAQYQTEVFDIYANIMTYMPFYPCPGNHDYESVCAIPCFSNPTGHSGPYFDIIDVPTNGEAGGVPSSRELYYSFDYGNVHFISLNSELGSLLGNYDWNGVYSAGNFNSSPVRQWLISDLSANTLPWVVVYFHQCPYTKGSHDSDNPIEIYMAAMRQNYNPIFEQYGVDIVLSGHSHVYERSYLLKGHYGNSSTFNNSHKADGSSGKFSMGEPYVKYLDGPSPNTGTVYVVQGNSGSGEPGASLNHPAMYYGDDSYGSFVLEVNGMRLDGKYLRSDGTIQDEFTIIKTGTQVVSNVSATICTGESYFAGGANQTASGTYYDTVVVPNGPDSVIVTQLTVNPPILSNRAVSICQGESYFVGGGNQTIAGTYSDIFTSAIGCDSMIVTQLTVLSSPQTIRNPQICLGQSFFAGGALQTTSGIYTDVFTAANGCDSTVITNLSVVSNLQQTLFPSICQGDSYFAEGAYQTLAGDYRDTFTAAGGCDSIVITKLTVQPPQQETVNVSICAGETYFAGGALQSAAGVYYDSLQTSVGCDSLLITVLAINDLPASPSVTQLGNSLSVPATFVSYQWYLGSAAIPGGNLNLYQPAADGEYFVEVTDANGCKTFSDTVQFFLDGIAPISGNEIQIFPNPVDDELQIVFPKAISGRLQIDVYNVLGEKISEESHADFNASETRISFSKKEPGVYLVRVKSDFFVFASRVVKN